MASQITRVEKYGKQFLKYAAYLTSFYLEIKYVKNTLKDELLLFFGISFKNLNYIIRSQFFRQFTVQFCLFFHLNGIRINFWNRKQKDIHNSNQVFNFYDYKLLISNISYYLPRDGVIPVE